MKGMAVKRRFLWWILAFVQLQTSGSTALAQRRSTILLYRPTKNHGCPLVQLRFNNRLIGVFPFDTGTEASLLTDAMATKLGLSRRPAFASNGLPILIDGKQAEL